MQLRQPEIKRAHRPQRSSVGRAQHRWLGKRVAEIALQRGSSEAEHRADDQAEQHARQAQVDQDGARDFIPAPGEDREDASWRQRHGAKRQRAKRRHKRKDREDGEEQWMAAGAHGLHARMLLLRIAMLLHRLERVALWRRNWWAKGFSRH